MDNYFKEFFVYYDLMVNNRSNNEFMYIYLYFYFCSSCVDMIAVPTMIFNAMEHWGMITYREAGMLYEVSVSSEADKQWIAIIVAHELSHQVCQPLSVHDFQSNYVIY